MNPLYFNIYLLCLMTGLFSYTGFAKNKTNLKNKTSTASSSSSSSSSSSRQAPLKLKKQILINGGGASFPYILYSKWFLEYHKLNPLIKINYRSIGSSGGIRQFMAGVLDFGATDVPAKKELLKKSLRQVVHIPITLSAVVVTYNIKSLKDNTLKLNASILRKIYKKEITSWNHDSIKQLNPKLKLPDQNIVPVYRADGSGTTAVFTEFLAKNSKKWSKNQGYGKSIKWPTGIGAKGNEGVLGLIQKIEGSMGYVGMSYALMRKQKMAHIQNIGGHYVKPTLNNVRQTSKELLKKSEDMFNTLVSAKGKTSYPLSAYSYFLLFKDIKSEKEAQMLKFLHWALGPGQDFSTRLGFSPLPLDALKKIKNLIDSSFSNSKTNPKTTPGKLEK